MRVRGGRVPDNDASTKNERVACQTLKEYGGRLIWKLSEDPGKAHVMLLGLLRRAVKLCRKCKMW